MPLQQKNITLTSFVGGIVDNYIEADDTHAKTIENFNITSFGKIRLRNGFIPIFNSNFNTPITAIAELKGKKVIVRSTVLNEFDEGLSTVTSIVKPNAGAIIVNTLNTPSRLDSWLDHLIFSNSEYQIPKKIYIDEVGTMRSEELGMPDVVENVGSPITITSARGNASTHKYIYAFHYSKNYNVGQTVFKVVGSIKYKAVTFSYQVGITDAVADPLLGLSTVSITSIPSLTQATENIFLTGSSVEIYRSYAGGEFLKVGEISNGTTTFTDSVTNSESINSNILLYTPKTLPTGYHNPPKCKFVSITNNTGYFANSIEYGSINIRPNRIYQSIPGIVNSSNPDFFIDIDYEIKGISTYKTYPIVFTSNSVYRLEGGYSPSSASVLRSVIIADGIGCVSDKGIVSTPDGLIWCGNDGIYFTDGFRVKLLSIKIKNIYQSLINTDIKKSRVSASYNKFNDYVYFTMSSNDISSDRILVYSLITNAFWFYTGATFTPISMMNSSDNFLYYTDFNGYIYKENKKSSSDTFKNLLTDISLWIPDLTYSYITSAIDMGDRFLRKVMTRLVVETKSSSDISIGLTSINDDGKISRDMKHIVSKGSFVWGDNAFVWGNPDTIWRKQSLFSSTRRFPRGTTRCRSKQISLSPTRVIIYKSDLYGQWDTLTHDALLGEITINLPVGGIFPVDVIRKQISFDNDLYFEKYTIIKRLSDTAILAKAVSINTLTTGRKWEISGFITNQSFELESLSIKYAMLDNIEGHYDQSSEGGNN